MARVRLTESKLRQIIRESVQNILNEDGPFQYSGPRPETDPMDRTPRIPELTPRQNYEKDLEQYNKDVDTARQNYQDNSAANTSLERWNKLGTVGQIMLIQQAVGAKVDGKLGPQTLGKILMKVTNGQPIKAKTGTIYPQYLGDVNWNYGKPGTYTSKEPGNPNLLQKPKPESYLPRA